MMSSQNLALSASGRRQDLRDRKASSHVRIPNSRVITKIAKSFLPCKIRIQNIYVQCLNLRMFQFIYRKIKQYVMAQS